MASLESIHGGCKELREEIPYKFSFEKHTKVNIAANVTRKVILAASSQPSLAAQVGGDRKGGGQLLTAVTIIHTSMLIDEGRIK